MSQSMLITANSQTDTGQISTIAGNLGIPLTGGLAAGFAIGLMKGLLLNPRILNSNSI
jgi:hypothetical protein